MDEVKDLGEPEVVHGETCPMCKNDTLTLMEQEKEIPFFGKVSLFSMNCSTCKYHKADIECTENRKAAKYTVEISSEEDMNIRIVRSSHGTIKIPRITEIRPGPAANGYVTNIEGVLNRVKKKVEILRDGAEDNAQRKKAKNMLKKIQKVIWGQEKIKISIQDPTGNSAIISDKAVKS